MEHLNGWVARRARELGTRAEVNDALAEQMRRAEAVHELCLAACEVVRPEPQADSAG